MATFADILEEIQNVLDIPEEELTSEQKETITTYLKELSAQGAEKVDKFCSFLKMTQARIDACRAEAQRLQKKARAMEGRISWLEDSYLATMQEHGVKKIEGEVYTVSVRKAYAVDIEDINTVPKELVRRIEEVKPDKVAIGKLLKSGMDVPGCKLAETYSLQVR